MIQKVRFAGWLTDAIMAQMVLTGGGREMSVRFIPIPSEDVIGWQAGGVDSYGLPAKQKISDGDGVPCRHYMENIGKGDSYLDLAHRPLSSLYVYAEIGQSSSMPLHVGGPILVIHSPQSSTVPAISCAAMTMMRQ